MKYTLTDKLLLLLADYFDFNTASFSVSRMLSYKSGGPEFRENRIWMEKYLKDKNKRKKFLDRLYILYKRGFLKRIKNSNATGYTLQPKGFIRVCKLRSQSVKKQRLPKNQWVMVFFDIPEKMRKNREVLRCVLKSLGYDQLQKSIWVTPYKVTKESQEIIQHLNISKFVQILNVQKQLIKK